MTVKGDFAVALLKWFAKNKRDYPWRRTVEPYQILIAELMLRKTTARQVADLYDNFTSRFPSVESLAEAKESEIKQVITPLGMKHKRPVLLKKFAQAIIRHHKGTIPDNAKELLELPGVGRYACNAVLCLSFGEQVPLVDTNVIRVLCRVFDFKPQTARARNDKAVWDLATSLLPRGRAREFNLAMLDLAAKVCTLRKPACPACPVNPFCAQRIGLKR